MTTHPSKTPKKEKEKRQSPEARQEALRYNQMMYGPTAHERRALARKVHQGAAYLKHPKFLALMAAFRKGDEFKFEVTDKGKTYLIAASGTHLHFDGKTLFYSRSSNRYEDHLLMDRATLLQYQSVDAIVHLVAAVLRSLPGLEALPLSSLGPQLFYGPDPLDANLAEQGPNLMIGSFKHGRVQDKPRK
jgi:hypothetical protein